MTSANPLFTVKTHILTLEQLWQHFEDCLAVHDWTYQYSDDPRYWCRGNSERTYILHIQKVLSSSNEKLATELYDKYDKE